MKFVILDEFVKDQLKEVSDRLESDLKIEGLSHTLHFVLVELVGNAAKANLKRVWFERNDYDLSDPESYAAGIKKFIEVYPTINESEYRHALEELNIHVSVQIDLNHERLLITVENNIILLEEEEKRIRRQLAGSSDIKNIVDFSVRYGDETEGRGLGLAMIVILMRDLGFDPEHFRVYDQDNRTIARLEFPLNANYVPIRERYKREHGIE